MPLQLSLRMKLRDNKPGKPTLGFTISRDVEYRQVWICNPPQCSYRMTAVVINLSGTCAHIILLSIM